jgi:MFS family permease
MNLLSPAHGPRRAALAFIFITIVLDMLALGMIIPVLPALIEDFLGGDTAGAAKVYGVFGTVWALMQFVAMPVLGALSDRFGRRPVILLSNLGLGLDYVLMALAPNLAWLFVGRVISGITAASVSTGMAYVADVTPIERRSAAFGIVGVAFGLGFVLGPAIGGLLSSVSLAVPGYAAAALAAANGLAAFFVLPEPAAHVRAERRPHLEALLGGVSRPGIRRLILIYFIAILAFSGMEATFALLAVHRYGLDQRQVSYVFALIGVVATVVQGGLIGPLSRRFGERALLVAGLLLQAAALAALPYAGSVAGLLVATVPLAFGSSLTIPSLTSLISRSARAEDQGGTLGIGQSAAALGRIAGPISATHAYSQLSFAAPYLGGAALMLAGAAVGSTLRRPPRHEPVEPGAAPAEEG